MKPGWKNNTIGSVYFIQEHGHDGYIKIGFTTDIKARIKDLQNASAHELSLLLVVNDIPASWEAKTHKALIKSHYRGEWFYPTEEVYGYISVIKDVLSISPKLGNDKPFSEWPLSMQYNTVLSYLENAENNVSNFYLQ